VSSGGAVAVAAELSVAPEGDVVVGWFGGEAGGTSRDANTVSAQAGKVFGPPTLAGGGDHIIFGPYVSGTADHPVIAWFRYELDNSTTLVVSAGGRTRAFRDATPDVHFVQIGASRIAMLWTTAKGIMCSMARIGRPFPAPVRVASAGSLLYAAVASGPYHFSAVWTHKSGRVRLGNTLRETIFARTFDTSGRGGEPTAVATGRFIFNPPDSDEPNEGYYTVGRAQIASCGRSGTLLVAWQRFISTDSGSTALEASFVTRAGHAERPTRIATITDPNQATMASASGSCQASFAWYSGGKILTRRLQLHGRLFSTQTVDASGKEFDIQALLETRLGKRVLVWIADDELHAAIARPGLGYGPSSLLIKPHSVALDTYFLQASVGMDEAGRIAIAYARQRAPNQLARAYVIRGR
jgi:hypothetical protein